MKLGIAGLPNVGRSTLFNSLAKVGAKSANYSFCTIDPNINVVPAPDVRLDKLIIMYSSEKATLAIIEFVDIVGLVKGAPKGGGLGSQFLSNVHEVDAIARAIRCFDDPNVIHVDGYINLLRDIETISLELIFSDIKISEQRIAKQSKGVFNDRDLAKGVELLKAIKVHLEDGELIRSFEPDDDGARKFINALNLLTQKPMIFAVNVVGDDLADDGTDNQYVRSVRRFADESNCEVSAICTEIEQEITELDDDEKKIFLDDPGLTEFSLEKLITASYRILGLMSYLTAGPQESRAWTIRVGTKTSQVVGKIHNDSKCGFTRTEAINYDDLMACGNVNTTKEKDLVRSEDKEYIMRDGDVVSSCFNVQAATASQLWIKSFMQVLVNLKPL